MGELINGRTPEVVKDKIFWCYNAMYCSECKYAADGEFCSSDTVLKDALDLIERLESERDAARAKVPKWISVEERLPEKEGDYIALIALHQKPTDYTLRQPWFVSRVYYRKKVGFHWHTGKVTHWMPLPELPEEETT